MQDLTKINVPLGLLDQKTQKALAAHGGPYESYSLLGKWEPKETLNWVPCAVYRAKPHPEPKAPEKPEVKVGSWWKDQDGDLFEVMHICGGVAFVKFSVGTHGVTRDLSVILETCTPYNPPRKCEGWVNVYEDGDGCRFGLTNYANEQNARDEGSVDELYIATVRFEYVEGQDNA